MVQIEHFELTSSRPAALALGAGTVIRVTRGRVWLTLQGQPEDVWLHACEQFTVPASGTVWVSAEPAAQFQVARAVSAWRGAGQRLFGQAPSLGRFWLARQTCAT